MFKKLSQLICTGGILLGASSSPALAAANIALLLPDVNPAATPADPANLPLAQAWLDAVNEEGYQVDVIHDSDFATLAANYKGIILPDSVHQRASTQLNTAINDYVTNKGGQVMIVYDFGALDANGFFPAAGPNPFSTLVGVDYNQYGELYGQTITPVGLGPIYGRESTLWNLQVPPGKYMTWPTTTVASTTTTAATTTTTTTTTSSSNLAAITSPASIPTAYLSTNTSSPGAMVGYDHSYIHKFRHAQDQSLTLNQIIAAQDQKIPAQAIITANPNRVNVDPVSYVPGDTLEGISGYIYGFLTYPSYVTCNLGHTSSAGNIANFTTNCTTTGQSYAGKSLLVSDRFGLIAGSAPNGSGNVLFVNLPLSYLKGQTDGMLMHGFIHYFGDSLLHLPRMSNVPKGIPGITVNVHVDSDAAKAPIQQMQTAGIWNYGPFSVHFTGGPVVDYFECQIDSTGNPIRSLPVNGQPATCSNLVSNPLGDVVYQKDSAGNLIVNPNAATGLNIPADITSQQLVQFFKAKGHTVGPHGGWLHDYYGYNAHDDIYDTSTSPATLVNPSNASSFSTYLQQNKSAVENAANLITTEYSAPVGNNPKWAVTWLENQGILGMYYLGDTGMGPTRHWREGQLQNQKVWMYPVMPFGLYATFEDFTQFGVNSTDVSAWLNKLVDFDVTNGTSRMVYFHPPGAINYLDSLSGMLSRASSYANSQSYNFNFYTISDLSAFMSARKQVSWSSATQADGSLLFQLSHPQDLNRQTLVLPKVRYTQPVAVNGSITIGQDKTNWLVQAGSGSNLSFKTTTGVFDIPPSITITAPTANSSFNQGTAINIAANASDSDGSVTLVEFYDGMNLLGSATTAPYSYVWNGAALGTHTINVKAYDTGGATTTSSTTINVNAVQKPASNGTGLLAQYYTNNSLSGNPTVQRIEAVNFNWGFGSPASSIPVDNFSARWSGVIEATTTGTYQFQTNSDDGVRVWVDGQLLINNWTNHGATQDTSVGINLTAGQRATIVIEYYEYVWTSVMQLSWKKPGDSGFNIVPASQLYVSTAPGPVSNGVGLTGQYFNNKSLSGSAVLQRNEAVNFNWGYGSPAPVVQADNFSARWSGFVEATATGSYQFQTNSDDGVRVWVNGQLLIDDWADHPPTLDNSGVISLIAGQRAAIVVEYYEDYYSATMQLNWKKPGDYQFGAIPASQLYPTTTPGPVVQGSGLSAQYFGNSSLSGNPILQRTEAVNFTWGFGSPGAPVPADYFSARWSGFVQAPTTGAYQFQTNSDDGVRVWVNGQLVISNWTQHCPTTDTSAVINLIAGQKVAIEVDYFEAFGSATMQLNWKKPWDSGFTAIPAAQLYQ